MIKNFNSIRAKLVFLLSLSALVAILFSSIALFIYTLDTKKAHSVNDLVQLTNILAENLIAPIESENMTSAQNVLKSLNLNQNIQGAFLFKEKNTIFASYKKEQLHVDETNSIIASLYAKHSLLKRFEYVDASYIISGIPIFHDNKFIASFIIISDTQALQQLITEQFLTQFLVALATILLIILLAFNLQKIFTLPIFTLKNAMKNVSLNSDYTLHINEIRDDEFQDLFDGFNNMIGTINDKNEQLNKYTQKISTLLNNAAQGFLSFNAKLIIDDGYSRECINLLGEDLSGKNIVDILLKTINEKELFIETVSDAIEQDDEMLQECILSLLPSELILNKKALKIEYKLIDNDKIMLIITNITAQKKLEDKVEKEQEVLKMIVEIASDSETFFDTKRDYETYITSFESLVDKNRTALCNINEQYRIIHTFKGIFSQLYMQNMVHFLHDIESSIALMIQDSKASNDELLKLLQESDFILPLEQEIQNIKNILGEEFLRESNYIKVDFQYLNELQEKITTFMLSEDLEASKYKDLFEKILNLSNIKLINLLKPYTNFVIKLAKRLEKEIYNFEIIGDSNITITEEYKPFIKSLIHVFRNSIDHGIEDPETRAVNSKDEKGTLKCSFEKKDKALYIQISDDGAGMNKEKIIQKAIEKNIVTQQCADTMSEESIYELIFHNQFSTKDEISDISGRGVGMSALKAELEALGGKIQIKSKPNVGTTFIFIVPCKEL